MEYQKRITWLQMHASSLERKRKRAQKYANRLLLRSIYAFSSLGGISLPWPICAHRGRLGKTFLSVLEALAENQSQPDMILAGQTLSFATYVSTQET